ncbi:MAG: aminotransferase class III-fold pyridoxal phosphate-dependent enzyme [Desulfobacteraceae bacterium]|nr:MAG: aminotransferase class III-fold pyridoxal phosphate-dependent enzyme [Desulfobacteraceae bacterium]
MDDLLQDKRLDAETIRSYEAKHVLYPWIPQKGNKPLVADHAKGSYFYDSEGRQYLDFSSQFVFTNLGHTDDRVVKAITDQAARLPVVNSQFATEPKAKLAKLLADITPADVTKSFFSTGGTEANEGAIKIARVVTGKQKIITRYRAYHGSTYGSMSLSADFRNWNYEPAVPNIIHCLECYCYRCPFHATHPNCDIHCAQHVEDVIRREGGARRVAAVIFEPIMGPGGMIVPPDGYWQKLREICNRHEVVLISDEVMTGFGRTGKWFGIDHWGVVPDMMTMAKGITSGYVPLGATAVRQWVADKFDEFPYLHGHTYSGHALAMAAAVATIQAYQQDDLIDNSARMGDYLMQKMHELQEKHPSVGDVRGKGLFCGMELVKSRRTKEPVHEALMEPPRPPTAKNRILAKMMEEGVYILAGAASVLMLTPPLNITRDEIDHGMSVIDRALEISDAEYRD